MQAVRILDTVNLRDVRVVERREKLRFALEPREALTIACQGLGKHLHSNAAIEARVVRAVYLTPYRPRRARQGSRTGRDACRIREASDAVQVGWIIRCPD
jgi:hypothetical protein